MRLLYIYFTSVWCVLPTKCVIVLHVHKSTLVQSIKLTLKNTHNRKVCQFRTGEAHLWDNDSFLSKLFNSPLPPKHRYDRHVQHICSWRAPLTDTADDRIVKTLHLHYASWFMEETYFTYTYFVTLSKETYGRLGKPRMETLKNNNYMTSKNPKAFQYPKPRRVVIQYPMLDPKEGWQLPCSCQHRDVILSHLPGADLTS